MQSTRVDLLQVGRHVPPSADHRCHPPSCPYVSLTILSICVPSPIYFQFHWNDYSDPGYMSALEILQQLQEENLILTLGLCNFDAKHMDEICTTLGPNSIVSNQVQVCPKSFFIPLFSGLQSHNTCLMTTCFLLLYVIYIFLLLLTSRGSLFDSDSLPSYSSRSSTHGRCMG